MYFVYDPSEYTLHRFKTEKEVNKWLNSPNFSGDPREEGLVVINGEEETIESGGYYITAKSS